MLKERGKLLTDFHIILTHFTPNSRKKIIFSSKEEGISLNMDEFSGLFFALQPNLPHYGKGMDAACLVCKKGPLKGPKIWLQGQKWPENSSIFRDIPSSFEENVIF